MDYKTSIGEWKQRDIQYCRFPGYDLTYAHYSKFPSWGLQDLISTEVNIITYNQQYPFLFYKKLLKILIENTTREYVNVFTNTFFGLIYCAQLLLNYINEYSPLVLFSWWRNKISWNHLRFDNFKLINVNVIASITMARIKLQIIQPM